MQTATHLNERVSVKTIYHSSPPTHRPDTQLVDFKGLAPGHFRDW